VVTLSRVGLEDVGGQAGRRARLPHPEARAVAATCGGIRVTCVYVPNGRMPDSEHHHYKLAWLAAMREVVGTGPGAAIVCGDMEHRADRRRRVRPDAYIGQTHVTPPERAAWKIRPALDGA
jgi:exodeoxyribonuclease III